MNTKTTIAFGLNVSRVELAVIRSGLISTINSYDKDPKKFNKDLIGYEGTTIEPPCVTTSRDLLQQINEMLDLKCDK